MYASCTAACSMTSRRRALSDDRPVVHDDQVAHDAQDAADPVLHQEDRPSLAGQLADQLEQLLALAVVEAGRRLVEQQHLDVHGDEPGHLDQTHLAGPQRADLGRGDAGEAHALQRRGRLRRAFGPRPAGDAARAPGDPGERGVVEGQGNVLHHGQGGEQALQLEGAAHAAAGPLVHGQGADVLAPHEHPAAGGPVTQLRQYSTVDLPAPFGPMRPTTWPERTWKDTSRAPETPP